MKLQYIKQAGAELDKAYQKLGLSYDRANNKTFWSCVCGMVTNVLTIDKLFYHDFK